MFIFLEAGNLSRGKTTPCGMRTDEVEEKNEHADEVIGGLEGRIKIILVGEALGF